MYPSDLSNASVALWAHSSYSRVAAAAISPSDIAAGQAGAGQRNGCFALGRAGSRRRTWERTQVVQQKRQKGWSWVHK
jgi:predicted RecA/RadA family phage recombinase